MDTTQDPRPQLQIVSQQTPDHLLPSPLPVLISKSREEEALDQAKLNYNLVVGAVQYLDTKIGPILTADGVLVAACITILSGQAGLVVHPATRYLLEATLLLLLYSLLMAINALVPTLKLNHWWTDRFLPEKSTTGPTSIVFFGQIGLYQDANAYADAAKVALLDEAALLDDLLRQTYANARIAIRKGSQIAYSAYGLLLAVVLLLLSALMLSLKV